MNYQELKSEIDTDSLARGYSGMNDQEVANSLNGEADGVPVPADIDREVDRGSVHGDEMYNVADNTEFLALTSELKDRWVTFTRSDSIDLQSPANQDMVNHIFGNPSTSRTAMIALSKETVSRGTELGLGFVSSGSVAQARAL